MTSVLAGSAPRVVVSASIAFDNILAFPGFFGDHILPEKTHMLSVSFLVDSLRRHRGGVGGNISYNLGLLGEPSVLVGAVGPDYSEYRSFLASLGVDQHLVLDVEDALTATAFVMSDHKDNQIAAFYPGASGHAAELDVTAVSSTARYGLVGANAPDAMRLHAAQIASAGARLIYDPSQQVVALSPEDLQAGIADAWALIGNDYEFAMIERKTGLSVEALTAAVPLVVVTFGDQGSELRHKGQVVRVPSASAERVSDPTGAGDAYRAGLIKGLLLGLDLAVVGRIAGLAGCHAVEQHGTQEHAYTATEFVARFNSSFPDYAGAVSPEMFVVTRS